MPVQQQEEAVVPCCSSQEASNKNAELLAACFLFMIPAVH